MAFAARQMGLRQIIGYINYENGSVVPADGVEIALRRALIEAGFPGDDVTVLRGSARAGVFARDRDNMPQGIYEVVSAIEAELPTPARDEQGPVFLSVYEQRMHWTQLPEQQSLAQSLLRLLTGGGRTPQWQMAMQIRGILRSGTLQVGDELETVGILPRGVPQRVIAIQMGAQTVSSAMAGDEIGVLLETTQPRAYPYGWANPCQAYVSPGSCKVKKKVTAQLEVLSAADGGRFRGMPHGMRPQISMAGVSFRTRNLILDDPNGIVRPGTVAQVQFPLPSGGLVVESGQGFICRQQGRVIALGRIESKEE